VVDARPKRRNERNIDAPKNFPPDIPRDASDNREKPGCAGYSKKRFVYSDSKIDLEKFKIVFLIPSFLE
jgi:hypothetical protein